MNNRTPIAALKTLELTTEHLDEMVAFYTTAFGLEVRLDRNQVAELHCVGAKDPSLILVSGYGRKLRRLDFELIDGAMIAQASAWLSQSGAQFDIKDGAIRLHDPDGCEIHLHEAADNGGQLARASDKPHFLSHVVINSVDIEKSIAFYRDKLGFEIADAYEKDLLTFLRSNQPQHHCIGISPAERAGLNHFALDCGGVDGVMRGISRMKNSKFEPIWGPGRHGPGGNIFCYFADPDGYVAEFTSDVMDVDPIEHRAKVWPRTPENANTWGSGGPSRKAISLMSGSDQS